MTVYNHFATDADRFDTCSSHWFTFNPPPDFSAWRTLAPRRTPRRGGHGRGKQAAKVLKAAQFDVESAGPLMNCGVSGRLVW